LVPFITIKTKGEKQEEKGGGKRRETGGHISLSGNVINEEEKKVKTNTREYNLQSLE